MAQVAKEHDDHHTPCLRLPFAVFGRVAVAGALVVGVSACSSSSAGTRTSASTPGSSVSDPVVTAGAASGLQQQYESVIKAVLPSVVEIRTSVGLGSGIVYDAQGDIVTNDHVVGSAPSSHVQFASTAKPVTGSLVGYVPRRDLA